MFVFVRDKGMDLIFFVVGGVRLVWLWVGVCGCVCLLLGVGLGRLLWGVVFCVFF